MKLLQTMTLLCLTAANASATDCKDLQPVESPSANLANIQDCLNHGRAILTKGVFEIDESLNLPDNAVLKGKESEIKLIESSFSIIEIGSSARIYFVKLNGNHKIAGKSSAVVHFNGSYSIIDHSHIYNSPSTGVYFIGKQSTGNRVLNSQIRNNFYGVIFRYTYTTSNINKLQSNRIHNNDCDGITLAGFGIVTDNRIYNNGRDCKNGIAGAGIYSLNNKRGALILSNKIYNNKGHNIDLDTVSNFIIEGNESYKPGTTALSIVDSSYNKIRNNLLTNSSKKTKSVKGTTAIKSMSFPIGGKEFQDFPHKEKQAISFFIGKRKNGRATTGNEVTGNAIRSYCSNDCVGLGLFVSRGTKGNTFEDNTMFGSQYGSRRCGDNNYDGGLKNHDCKNY